LLVRLLLQTMKKLQALKRRRRSSRNQSKSETKEMLILQVMRKALQKSYLNQMTRAISLIKRKLQI